MHLKRDGAEWALVKIYKSSHRAFVFRSFSNLVPEPQQTPKSLCNKTYFFFKKNAILKFSHGAGDGS